MARVSPADESGTHNPPVEVRTWGARRQSTAQAEARSILAQVKEREPTSESKIDESQHMPLYGLRWILGCCIQYSIADLVLLGDYDMLSDRLDHLEQEDEFYLYEQSAEQHQNEEKGEDDDSISEKSSEAGNEDESEGKTKEAESTPKIPMGRQTNGPILRSERWHRLVSDPCSSYQGFTPLALALNEERVDMASLLIKAGAELDLRQRKVGHTALHLAILQHHRATVNEQHFDQTQSRERREQKLRGYRRAIQNSLKGRRRSTVTPGMLDDDLGNLSERKEGVSVLSLPSTELWFKVVQLLLARRANVDVFDHKGTTPLMLAASFGHEEVVKLLIENQANLDDVDKLGWRALTYAAYGGHPACAKLLFEAGASKRFKDKLGLSPDAMAAYMFEFEGRLLGHSQTQAFLEEAKATLL